MVALPDRAVAFDLRTRHPVWTLWAGPGPQLDLQLPPEIEAALADVDAQVAPRPPEPGGDPVPQPSADGRQRARGLWKRLRNHAPEAPSAPRTWLDDALDAEFADDWARAAELHERNGDPLRAAHLYERAARHPGTRTSRGDSP